MSRWRDRRNGMLAVARNVDANRRTMILKMLADDLETDEIAQRLGYSRTWVQRLLQRLKEDIGVRTRQGAVAWGFRNGVLE
jgi:DNA-binding CsgD family transcriptional regulator